MNVIRYFFVALVLLVPLPLLASASAIEKLNIFVQTIATLKVNFTQTVIDPYGNVTEQAEGQFALKRPGKFRWDYDQPYPQHIVADGERIWFYDVDLEQVSVQPQNEALADTPATLLSGAVLPQDKYLLTELPSDDGMFWVALFPKDAESNFQTVTLAFDEDGLRQMIMTDSFDQRTRLVFSQAQQNIELQDDEFIFIAPAGVDIVGDTGW